MQPYSRHKPFNPSSNHVRGFTLIEVMMVVAIVGILAAIALPNYSQYVMKGRRVDAKNALLDLAGRQERYFATHNQYTTTASELGYGADTSFPLAIIASGASHYSLSVAATGTADFTATATPQGMQTADACSGYTINNLGQQTNTGVTNPPTDCW